MNRTLKTIFLAFLLGAGVGAWDSSILMWREAGVMLLNPAVEMLEVLFSYGALTAIFGLIAALVFRKWQATTAAGAAGAATATAVAIVWVHSRILVDNKITSAESMMGTAFILGGAIVLWILMTRLSRGKTAAPFLALFILVPSVTPLLRGVQLDTDLEPLAAENMPDVTVLLLDTQRADRLSTYGYERPDGKKVSPVIDSLAAQGSQFEWAYSAAPWTRPSVASIFTGMYPTTHGAYEPTRALPDWTATMAEMFQGMGYRTGGFSANANISAVWGFAQGYERFWCLDDKELIDIVCWGDALNRARRMLRLFHETPDNARIVNEQVMPWFDEVGGGDRPVFTWVQYLDPHFPYDPEEDLINDDKPDYDAIVARLEMSKETRFDPYPFGRRPMPEADILDGFQKLYDAEVAFMDREIGKLIEQMRSKGLLDEDDWLIITSDHGEEFFEHDQWGHGQNLYHEVIRVPLIVVGPGVPAGQIIEAPISLVDILPTMADFMNKPEFMKESLKEDMREKHELPGKSLMPLFADPNARADDIMVYAEKLRAPRHFSLRDQASKVVRVRRTVEGSEGFEHFSFYDLATDPFETTGYTPLDMLEYELPEWSADRFVPLPTELADQYGRLFELIKPDEQIGGMGKMEFDAGFISQGAAVKELSSAERQRLIELGYINE